MTEPLHFLMVEDSPTDAKLITLELRRLGRPIEVERVEDAAGMRAAFARRLPDIVLCDWSLPGFGARAALELTKELGQELPFIIVSGTVGEEIAVEAMHAGAHDYVLKGNLVRLVPAIERELRAVKEHEARHRAEQALRESEARYRRIVETTNEGVSLIDADAKVTFVNARFATMLGYDADALIGTAVFDLMDEPSRASVRHAIEHHRAGDPRQLELELNRKDGTKLWVLLEANPIFDDAGRYAGALAMMADMTARKRAEEVLRQTENQLRQAQKMEAVGRLAGGVAHDFNNVLSVILSYGEILLGDLPADSPIREDIEEIGKAGRRAAELTRQLLTFSRQQVFEPTVVDLNDVLARIDKMLRRLVGEDVELVSVPSSSLGRVLVDPGGIEQVIMNLAVNARDAMPTGGKLTLETVNIVLDDEYAQQHLGVSPGAYVMLAVSDTGIGMDRATQTHIFEPFFTTKEKGKGTGLGLSMVFGIVQQSGGSIWVYSEVGQGTTFKIYLPLVEQPIEGPRSTPEVATLRGTETILLVEDEDQVRAVVHAILRRHGYQVIEAANAAEAIVLSEKHPGTIHLLLSDVVMPRMSGPELARRLLETRPAMKVLCMSGYTDDSIVRHGVLDASIAFLQKPVVPTALTRKVREVLEAPAGTQREHAR